MKKIIDLSKEQDLPGCVCAPVLLQEIMAASSEDIKKPVGTMLQILGELAMFISRVNNPVLRLLALRLGLFPMSQEELKKAIESETDRIREVQQKAQNKESKDGKSDTVAES